MFSELKQLRALPLFNSLLPGQKGIATTLNKKLKTDKLQASTIDEVFRNRKIDDKPSVQAYNHSKAQKELQHLFEQQYQLHENNKKALAAGLLQTITAENIFKTQMQTLQKELTTLTTELSKLSGVDGEFSSAKINENPTTSQAKQKFADTLKKRLSLIALENYKLGHESEHFFHEVKLLSGIISLKNF